MNFADSAPPVLRQISVRAAMDVLLHEGPTSRADLAKKTGLSKQTMSEVIRALEDYGWVRIKGKTAGHVGRTAVTYEISPDGGYAIGIDLGATRIRIAIVNIVGKIVSEIEVSTEGDGGIALIARLENLVNRLLEEAEVTRDRVLLATVATPGVVDPQNGSISFAPNIIGINSFDVVNALRSKLGCDVVVENDINAAVIGECWQGGAAGLDNAAYVALGTGIGLGLVYDGKLMRGATGAAGEISYLPFGADPTAEESLERGALEAAISAGGIMKRHREAGGQSSSLREIFELAQNAEPAAISTLRQTADIAAMLLVSVSAMFDPRKILLGGNIGGHPLMVQMIIESLPKFSKRIIDFERSVLGSRATLVGAVAIALNTLHNSLFAPQLEISHMRLPVR